MTIKEFDSQLKNDAEKNKFHLEGNYIVFDGSSNLLYAVLPHFTLGELLTHNPVSKYTKLSKSLLLRLQTLRDKYDAPIKINSSYRSPEYNKTVPGSSDKSLHTTGNALDLGVTDPRTLAALIDELWQDGERGIYSWGCHMGIGHTAKWDATTDATPTRKIKDLLVHDDYRNYTVFAVIGLVAVFVFRKMFR